MKKTFRSLVTALAFVTGGVAFTACSNESEEANNDEYYAAYASITSSDSNFTSTSKGGTINFKASGGEVRIYVSCGTDWLVENNNPTVFSTSITDTNYLVVTAGQNLVEEELAGTITLTTANRHIAFASITVIQNAYGAPEITVDTNEWHAPAVGELSTEITVEANVEWTVAGGAEWLTIDKGEAGLNLTVAENEDTEERTTEIVLNCSDGYNSDSETVIVTQDGLAYITLSEESLEFDASGGEAEITVESNFDWEYAFGGDWLSIEENEEEGSLKITCDASEVEEERGEVVTFTAGDGAANIIKVELPIIQSAYLMPRLTVEVEEWNVPAVGKLTTEIGVESTYDWEIECNDDWLTGEKTETGIRLTAAQNSETAERTAEVVLTCADDYNSDSAKIKVTQDGAAYITLSEEEFMVYAYKYTSTVSVESNYDWKYSCNSDWLTFESDENGKSLSITCLTNEDVSDREAVVTFTAGDGAANVAKVELKVTQKGFDSEKSLILEYSISSTGQTVELPLTSVTYALVNWGDGELETVFSDYPSHKYSSGGTYTVTVNGEVGHIQSCVSNNVIPGAEYLTAVTQWGDLGLNDMSNGFRGCTRLASLPDGPGPFSNVTSFSYCFYDCSSLTAVSENMFSGCTSAKNFNYCFCNCEKLASAPSFNGCSAITDFDYTFYNCSSLKSVLKGMFDGCSAIWRFDHTFYNCSSLETIPEGLFDNCSNVMEFPYTFYNCSSLKSVPKGLFNVFSAVSGFDYAFYNCSSLEAIPEGLFDGCSAVTRFDNTFYNCSSLEAIPEGLFDNCPLVTYFQNVFGGCSSLKSVPGGLFDNCPSVTDFLNPFYDCTALEVIPEGLFDNCPLVTSFQSVFEGCSSLKSVPEGLFDNCPSVTHFQHVFDSCSSLKSVPEGLFDNCPLVTSFYGVFSGCTALEMIPAGLFDNCPNVTTFNRAFQHCESLTEIPVGLFDNCPNVTDFSWCFSICSSLITIPAGLFDNCPNVTDFSYVFQTCSCVTEVPAGLFDKNLKAVGFHAAFRNWSKVTVETPYTEIEVKGEKVKVHLYDRAKYTSQLGCVAPTDYDGCFAYSSFSDMDSIPSDWGGKGTSTSSISTNATPYIWR